jgi:hypothetical protein
VPHYQGFFFFSEEVLERRCYVDWLPVPRTSFSPSQACDQKIHPRSTSTPKLIKGRPFFRSIKNEKGEKYEEDEDKEDEENEEMRVRIRRGRG